MRRAASHRVVAALAAGTKRPSESSGAWQAKRTNVNAVALVLGAERCALAVVFGPPHRVQFI